MKVDSLRSRMKICKVVIGISTALCILLLFFFYKKLDDAFHSHLWPTVQGIVIKSYVSRTVTNTSGYANFFPKVFYVYNVDGIDYKGNRIFFLEDGRGLSWSERKAEKYYVGKRVRVFYKQKNPRISVLEPGGSIKGMFLSGALHLILLGILMFLSSALLWDYHKVKKEMNKLVTSNRMGND